jgi:hypothetical protein
MDEGVVGGVEDQHAVVGARPGDPGLEVRARCDSAGGVVGRAEIGDVDALRRRRGAEGVRLGGIEVGDAGVAPLGVRLAGAPGHDVGVDVDGVDGVGDRDAAAGAEDLLDVAAVLLAAVGDEDLGGGNVDAPRLEVVYPDGFEQEVVAVLGAVAAKSGIGAEFVDGSAHGLDDSGGERESDVTDAEPDDLCFGVRLGEHAHAAPDLGKEVAGLELAVVLVQTCHGAQP